MDYETWAVFDTETTDLVGVDLLPLSKQPHIIEFSGVVITLGPDGTGEEVDVLDFLCKPGGPFGDKTEQITGLKWADVESLPPFKTHSEAVAAFFAKAQYRCAHNLTFDEKMLSNEYARFGAGWRPDRQRRICTAEQTEHFCGKRSSLSDLHEKLFGNKFEGAHRALVDVRALVRCIRELRRLNQL